MSDPALHEAADATDSEEINSSPEDDPFVTLNDGDDDGNGNIGEEQTFFRNLCGGFAYLRRRRDGEGTTSASIIPPPCVLPTFLSRVTVNFIDPTSSSITTSASTTSIAPTVASTNTTSRTLSLYEKFTSILERDYACTLTFVPYQLFRNNASGIIENLAVKTVLTQSHGGSLGILPDLPATSDEICDEPYCHVYLAACEGYEHYRTKVKPSLQAFVSQLEAAALKKSSLSSSSSVSTSTAEQSTSEPQQQQNLSKSKHQAAPRYVIVYVPTGDKNRVEEMSPKKGAKMSVASRFAAARQRISAVRGVVADPTSSSATAASTSVGIAESSSHSGGTAMDSTSENYDAGAEETSKNPISQKLTKVEREILRRFKSDFPNGNVCTLSTLVSESVVGSYYALSSAGEDNDDREEYLQKLEWNAVLKCLGNAVAAGFQDRCQWFDEELRKIDRRRRQQHGGGTAADSGELEANSGFQLQHFFLVKESLAFTYEQMRLPAEALLQYEELRAFLPENAPKNDFSDSDELSRMALLGDCRNFREKLRAHDGDFDTISSAVDKYLFAREISLLFQMHKSIRAILRCLMYAKSLYKTRRKKIEQSEQQNADGRRNRLIEIDEWVFRFCWDVKIASDRYFKSSSSMKTTVDEFFARSLCDLIEFARLRLISLGEALLPHCLIHSLRGIGLLEGVQSTWDPWVEPENPLQIETQASFEVFGENQDFLKDALSSDEAFLTRYLQLTKVFADYNEFCGRDRYAARLRTERIEIFFKINDIANATAELLSIIDIYGQDMWNMCQFSLLFRLASFQRESATALDYLTTLVRCFGDQMSDVAPSRATEALHDDLEAVVGCPSLTGSRFSAATLFSPSFGLEGISIPRGAGTDRNLVKKLYTIGDTVHVTLVLNSFLPKPIDIDSFSIKLVPFRTYVAAMEDHLPLEESDTFRTLTLTKASSVLPGSNKFSIDWLPKVPGQFIVSSAVILWKGVEFTYTAKELRRPTIRIDVVPCEPTQKIEVKPNFLIPGHEQPISFVFSAGSDVIKAAKLHLVCPPGISMSHPDAVNDPDGWISSYEAELPLCAPSESVCLTYLFKVHPVHQTEGAMAMQPVLTKVFTSYKYAEDEPGAAPSECMETSLVAKLPALGKAALTLIDYELCQYSEDRCLVNVLLRCNTPNTLTVEGWSFDLPKNLSFSDVGDLNECIKGKELIAGDRISFGVDCCLNKKDDHADLSVMPAIHVNLVNEHGTSFKESLFLGITKPFSFPPKCLSHSKITVEISLPSYQGLIGEPIDLEYKIIRKNEDSGSFSFSYKINDKTRDWITSGKLEGKTSSETIRIIGIPVTAGRIANFPSLTLAMEKNDEYIPLQVVLVKPDSFDCLLPPNHSSVAFPIGSSTRRYSKVSV